MSAQVIASWAVGWPYVATALLAFGGFFTVEGALALGLRAGVGRQRGTWDGGPETLSTRISASADGWLW